MSNFKKDYITLCGDNWLVYKWSTEYHRYINTHMYQKDDKQGAVLSCRQPYFERS